MSTIFEHIGFLLNNEEDVFRLADFAMNAGKIFLVNDGFYACYVNASGSEVWCRMALDHEEKKTTLLNIDPHYNGNNIWKLKVGQALAGDDYLDVKCVLYTEDEKHFICARIMGFYALKEFEAEKMYHFQTAMIPHSIEFFKDEDEYRQISGDNQTIVGMPFPYGMYAGMIANEDEERAASEVLITRLLCRVRECTHHPMQYGDDEFGGFYHLVCETSFGPLDVASSHCCEAGELAMIVGCISAKVIDEKMLAED